jgi:polysaccharide deacetylase 2 family uncharacterized protein YibQ
MTQNNGSPKRPAARGKGKRPPLSRGTTLALAGLTVAVFAGGIYLGVELAKPPPPPDLGGVRRDASPPPLPPARSSGEESEPAIVDDLEVMRQPPLPRAERPRIALIVDDLGRSLRDLDTLAGLGIPLTYSVLPYESRTPQVVGELRRRGAEFICHLPMEARNGANPGPGALLLGMDDDELRQATREALRAVDGAVGVNNHMGSGFSAERRAITTVLEVLAEDGFYYVDSRTGLDSLGYSVARRLGLPRAERQVFLDDDLDAAKIREQFARLLKVAAERGDAIAIGHPHPETLEVLAAEIGPAREQGFEFVTVSHLLERD